MPEPVATPTAAVDTEKTASKKSLVLDLDGCLISVGPLWSYEKVASGEYSEAAFTANVHGHNGIFRYTKDVWVRPSVSRLLTEMAPLYDIYIFTASIDGYANPIVDRIDTQKVIKQRFYRESCLHPYVKNLRLIRKDLSQVILVDDNAFSYEGHFNDNAILIKTWNKESNDTEIDKLINLLTRLHDVEDVRLEDKTLRFLFTSARPGNLVSYLSPNLTTDDDSFDSTSTNAVNLLPDTAFGHKKTLVLDLDGTLIYATDVLRPGDFTPHHKIFFNPRLTAMTHKHIDDSMNTGFQHYAYIWVRPGLERFLDRASRDFEVIVFTSASQEYADAILDVIDEQEIISHRLYRDSCTPTADGSNLKDLSRLGRKLRNVILIDDSPRAYKGFESNTLPIKSFSPADDGSNSSSDSWLRDMEKLLDELKYIRDVRVGIKEMRRRWREEQLARRLLRLNVNS